jgi:hypothetical protein
MVLALQSTKQVSAAEAEATIKKMMQLPCGGVEQAGVVGCVEHMEDGCALSPDAVNLAIDELTLLDRLIRGEQQERPVPTSLDGLVDEVKEQMWAAVNALADAAAQTGMPKWDRVVGGGKVGKEKGLVDLDTIVGRLRTSLPVMRAA